MAQKVLLKDVNKNEILPITRGELVLDSSGKQALHSDEFLATTSQPGLMSKEDKYKIDNISISTLEITDLLPNGKKIATISVGSTSYNILAPASYNWSEIDARPADIKGYGMIEALSDLNNATPNKFFYSSFQASNRPAYNYSVGFTLANSSITNYAAQLAIDYYGGVHTRYKASTEWSEWKELAPLSSIPTKLSQLEDDVVKGKYLPLSGGKMDGSIIFKEGTSLKVTNNNKQELHVLYLDPSSQNFLIGYQTGITGKHGTNLYGNNILFKSQGSSTTSMFLNNSGNLTIGSSNLAGDSARLYVAGKSIFSGSVTINNPEVNTPFEAAVTLDAKSYGSASYSQIQWKNGSDDSARYGYINLKGSVYGHANGIDIGRINGEDNRLWVAITQDGITANSFIGNLDGTYVNKLTGYTKATTSSAIAATDSLNTALGKLELKADTAYTLVAGAYDGDGTIENLAEILKVLEGISDTETIQAIVGKYLPLSGGTISGNLTVGADSASTTNQYYLRMWKEENSQRHRAMLYVDAEGTSLSYYNKTSGLFTQLKLGASSYKIGTANTLYDIIHSGNIGSYAFIPRADKLISKVDADNYWSNGAYLNQTGNGSGNSNFPNNYAMFLSFNNGVSNYVTQFDMGRGAAYYRTKIDTWSKWYQFITDENIGSQSVNYATSAGYADSAGNADTVDGYHATSLWRSDGATWNPGANVTMTPTANGQKFSFDFRSKGRFTGAYWHVWDESKSTLLKVDADSGAVSAPYGFVGNLTGKASALTDLNTNDAASATATKRKIWFSYDDGVTGRPALSDNLTFQVSTSTLFVPHINGKITIPGGSYSWYQVQQYNSSNGNPSYYSSDCAIININSYTGWQPWIRGVDSENGSWTIGQYTTDLHIGYIPKTNTSNALTYRWDFAKDGSTYFPGSVIVPTGLIWVQGGGSAGSNFNRLTTTSGMPTDMQYNTSKRGTQIYANGIAFCDPYNGNSNNDSGWIRHLETTANNGVLEIAMGDDAANEEIRFRYYNTSNNIAYDILVPRTTGTLALTSQIPTVTDYYWANVKVSASSSTSTSPTFATATMSRGVVGGYNNTSYALSTASFICNSWIRTKGSTGWYNEDYEGGWYMTDSTWIRNYNSKPLYMSVSTYPSLVCNAQGGSEANIRFEIAGANKGYTGYKTGYGTFLWNSTAAKYVYIADNGYFYTQSYINVGAGNEKNASNPPYVWGVNGSDNFMRTYATSSLSVNYANSAGSAKIHSGYSRTITVNGSSDTYYPVVINTSYSKNLPNIVTIWKDLGSPTASYAGNHGNGTSSCLYRYDVRISVWDGNGGYCKCLNAWYGYAPLVAHTEFTYSSVGHLCVWLRGGGTTYEISSTWDAGVTVYYSRTDLYGGSYPCIVEPRTSIGNGGVYSTTYLGYGDVVGNVTGSSSTSTRASYLSGHSSSPDNSHPGHGARVFYSWNIGSAGNSTSGYSNGITIGSHPNDTAYGFQIVQNMWDDRTYTRRYNSGWQEWKTLAWTSDIPTTMAWDSITGKPSTFTPSTHYHNYFPENTAVYFRDPNNTTWRGGMYWGSAGNEALCFAVTHSSTSFRFFTGSDLASWTSSTWQNTPKLEINSGGINVNGSITVTYNSYPGLTIHNNTTSGEASIYIKNNTAGWALGVNTWGKGSGVFGIGQYQGTGSSNCRLSIDNNGKVRIGTDSGGEALNVGGWIGTTGDTGWYNITYAGGMYMQDTTYVRTYNGKALFVSNSGQHAIYTAGGFASAKVEGSVFSTYYNGNWYGDTLYTHGNGNLSISAPGGSLYLSYNRGAVYFCGGSYYIDRSGYLYAKAYYETSDERLKNFYQDVIVDFNKLKEIPKKYFVWKTKPNELQIGTSAQVVQNIYPELVSKNANGLLNVDYSKLSVIALKGIDELYDMIMELRAENRQLREQIRQLQK